MVEPTTMELSTSQSNEFADELKCPICLELFDEPVLLECSHGLCLKCAKSLVLYDGGTNLPEVTCPLCKHVTAVGGGDEAREREDELIASALKRFDIMPPRKSRVRIEDLKGCYDAYLRDGLLEAPEEPKPTALHLWRAAVAKMEQQVLDKLGEKPKSGGEPVEDGEEEVEVEGGGEGPMEKLRFRRNVVLQSLVSLVKQQKAAAAATNSIAAAPAPVPITSSAPATTAAAAPPVASSVTAPAAEAPAAEPPAAEEVLLPTAAAMPTSPVREDDVAPFTDPLSSQPEGGDSMMVATPAPSEPQPTQEQQPPPYVAALSPQKEEEEPVAATHEPASEYDPTMAVDTPAADAATPTEPLTTTMATDSNPPPSDPNSTADPPSSTTNYDDDGTAHFFLDTSAPATTTSSLFPPIADPPTQQPTETQQQMKQQPASSSQYGSQGSRHLWAGHLSSVVTEPQLREAFSAFGPLEALRLLKRNAVQVLGFVHFHRTEDAIACKEALDGSTSHLGHNLKIQYQERGNNERCGTLRVHNLPPEATDSDVRKTFSEFGRVRSININPKTLIGFVQFDDDSQATLAMEKMHDQEFMSHHLFVDYAARDRDQPPPRRDRDGPSYPPPQRGPPAPRSAYDDYRSDRPDDNYRGPPPSSSSGRIITLPSPRGYPPFEAYGDQNLAQLRELVDLIQYRLPSSQRQTLEEALQNRELYENIQQLAGRNRRDLSAVLATLRAELGLPPRRSHQQPPQDDHRGGGDRGGGGGGDNYRGRPVHEGRGTPLYEGRGAPRRDSRDAPPPSSGYTSGYPPPSRDQGRYDSGRDAMDDGRGRGRDGGGYDGKAPARPPLASPSGGWRGDDRRPYGNSRDDAYGRPNDGGRHAPHMPPQPRPDDVRTRGERWDNPPPRSPPRRRSRSPSPGSRKRSRPMDSYPPTSAGGAGRYDSRPRSRSRSPRRTRRNDVLPPPPPPPQHQYQHTHHRDLPPSYPPAPRAPAGPLEAECEQFLQSMIGGGSSTTASTPQYPAPYPAPSYPTTPAYPPPTYAAPPPVAPPMVDPAKRMWLTSAQAAAYPCYEAVLAMVKDILMPFYRDARITKEDFKRAAEETTLKVVQQLLDVGLQNRADVPPHYRQLAYDAVRASLRL